MIPSRYREIIVCLGKILEDFITTTEPASTTRSFSWLLEKELNHEEGSNGDPVRLQLSHGCATPVMTTALSGSLLS